MQLWDEANTHCSLINDPDVLFFDDATSGLDPVNARLMKNMTLEEQDKGKTIILITQNMLNAQELCDRVAFIVSGRIAALDTPHDLMRIWKLSAGDLRFHRNVVLIYHNSRRYFVQISIWLAAFYWRVCFHRFQGAAP